MRLTTALTYSLLVAGLPKRGQAAVSPATSNCVDQNYTDLILYESEGGQYGICVFSNNTACEEWTFLRDQCDSTHPNFSVYCTDNGGEVSQENVDWGEVEGAPPATYEVCTANGEQCTDYDYYALNSCSLTSSKTDDICTANGGTSRVMGTVAGSDYTLCSFGNENACELGKLMSGECDKTNPSLISFCAESGGSMSLGGVEPLEFEKCTVGEMTCIEEDYYLNGGCDVTKEVEQPTEVPPDNDTCSNATVISNDGPIGLELGTVLINSVEGATSDEWSTDPTCSFMQVPPGEGVWYAIKGVEGGTRLRVSCSKMDCMLLTTNSTLGECPSMFLCVKASVGRDENGALQYFFTTEDEGIYYIYIAPKQEFPGPIFNLLVEEAPEPTMAPTRIVGTPTTSNPVSAAANGAGLGAFFNVALFAAMYFSV
mmetsp:Transcript_30548/g.45875  ORF Transcript_30548/g.45875 Transcript_30548/m.45875 type:complete len:427 (-) Transcript_30548:91-1371(-)